MRNEKAAQKARNYWERNAKRYDRALRVTVRAMPQMLEVLKAALQGTQSVLEVAAGTGIATQAIAQAAHQVVAVDYALAMVEKLKARVEAAVLKNVQCLQADIYALPFEPASFDAVVACNVLHLLPDLPKAYEAMFRLLKPGGRLFVPTVCQRETWTARLVAKLLRATGLPIQHRFRVGELRESLKEAGFHVQKEKVFPGLMPFAYLEGIRG